MKPEDEKRFNAIRAHVGTRKFTAGDIVQGSHRIRLGAWLKRHTGVVVDGFRLCRERDNHTKSWRFVFKPSVPPLDEMRERAEAEARLKHVGTLLGAVWENQRELKKIDEREEAAKGAELLVIRVQTPEPQTMRVAGPDGEPITVYYTWGHGPNGRPIKIPGLPVRDWTLPAATVAPEAPAEPIGCTPPDRLPIWTRERRQPTKQELIDAHNGVQQTPTPIPVPIWVQEKRHPTEVELKQWQREMQATPAPPDAWLHNGVNNFSNPDGTRTPVGGDFRDGWRTQFGVPNWGWRQKL